jgi:predicted dehydrogenase
MTTLTDSPPLPRTAPASRPVRRVGVIGGGKISEQHLSSLRRRTDVSINTVCDLTPSLARFSAERVGAPNWATDYREVIERGQLDVVHVLTPPGTHVQIVSDCLRAGLDVIVEKPIALSNPDFHGLWELAGRQGRRLVENHNYRFNEPVRQLQHVLASGLIGEVEEVDVRMNLRIRDGGRYADRNLPHPSHRLPAGVLHEFISHLAYLLLAFLPGGKVEVADTVRAAWRNHGGGTMFKFDDLDAMVLRGAAHGRIRFSARAWPDCLMVTARGSRGMAVAELFQPSFRVMYSRDVGPNFTPLVNGLFEGASAAAAGVAGVWRKVRNQSAYEGLDRFLNQVYDALRDGTDMPVSFAQMDETSRLIDALLEPANAI